MKPVYFCQYDNELYPLGSCNMTSLAMALASYGLRVPGSYKRMPDNLLAYCDAQGLDRHSLTDIAKVAQHFGLGDDASYNYSLLDVKKHLKGGNYVIVQGTFTPSGHVILVLDVDELNERWLCNDPAGHYPNYSGSNWNSGMQVWYPSAWFDPHASPDGKVWAHLLRKI